MAPPLPDDSAATVAVASSSSSNTSLETSSIAADMELLLPRRIQFVRASEQVSAKGLSGLDKKDADSAAAAAAPQRPNRWIFNEGALNEYQGWRTSKSYGAGLRNQGNTCYLNSVLQCLSYVSTFAQVSEARIHEKICDRKRAGVWCGLCNLSRLICRIHQSNGGCITPTEILRYLHLYFARFRPGRQEDAHDALRQLIDTCIRSEALQPKISASAQNKKAPFVAPLVSQTTMLGQMFGYHTAQRITCGTCGHVSSTFHFDLDISLPINKCRTLDECLNRYFAPEIFKEQNAYKCSKCKRTVTAKKTTRLYDAPMNLTLSFKRYGYGRFGGHRQKDGHFVKYDKELDLTKFITNKEDGSNTPCKYLLSGVLVHSGATPNLGHYYAFVRNPAGFWYCCDDESVTPAKEHTVLSQQAYILFYERKRQQQKSTAEAPKVIKKDDSIKNRKATAAAAPPSLIQHTSLFYTSTTTPDTPSTTASRHGDEDMSPSSITERTSITSSHGKKDKESLDGRLKRGASEEGNEEEGRSPKKAKTEDKGNEVLHSSSLNSVQESVIVRLHPPKFETVSTRDGEDSDDDMVAPNDVIEPEEPTQLTEVVKPSMVSANAGMKARERANLARSVRSQYGANKISSWDSDNDEEDEKEKVEREQARNDAIMQAQRKLQPKIAMRDTHDREYDKGKNRHKVHKQVEAKGNDFTAAYKRAKARLHGPRNKQQMLRDKRMRQRCRRKGPKHD